MFARDLGIDLGTASVLVYVQGKGVTIREPSVVALNAETRTVLAVGEEARKMIGRTPGNITAIRPLRDGVIADYDATATMLRHFIESVCGRRRVFKPQVVVCVPSGVTSVEKRAVLEAAIEAGARRVFLISEPMAAAIGAGLNVGDPGGNMVLDLGGGTANIAVISLGGEVVGDSVRMGGDRFDEAIVRYVRREYNLIIGERTAEQTKIELGKVYQPQPEKRMEIRGRDAVTGLPRTIEIDEEQVAAALEEPSRAIVQAVRGVLERTPPELSADIMDKGIVMTGGGSLLGGFAEMLRNETGIPAYVADDPISCVALGTGKVLDGMEKLKSSIILSAHA